jgi:hypothetical protein
VLTAYIHCQSDVIRYYRRQWKDLEHRSGRFSTKVDRRQEWGSSYFEDHYLAVRGAPIQSSSRRQVHDRYRYNIFKTKVHMGWRSGRTVKEAFPTMWCHHALDISCTLFSPKNAIQPSRPSRKVLALLSNGVSGRRLAEHTGQTVLLTLTRQTSSFTRLWQSIHCPTAPHTHTKLKCTLQQQIPISSEKGFGSTGYPGVRVQNSSTIFRWRKEWV